MKHNAGTHDESLRACRGLLEHEKGLSRGCNDLARVYPGELAAAARSHNSALGAIDLGSQRGERRGRR